MKEVLLIVCGVLIGRQLMAQTFSEWFRQNHTQLQYLTKQIAALRAYTTVLENGYGIAEDGLQAIDFIEEADRALHAGHFSALETASAAVKEDARVGAIVKYCGLLSSVADSIANISRLQPDYPVDWSVLGPEIADNIRQLTHVCRVWLLNLVEDESLEMGDAYRLEQLDRIYEEVRALYAKALYLLGELNENAIIPGL